MEAYLSRLKTRRASMTAARMGPSPGSSTIRSALHLIEFTNGGGRFRLLDHPLRGRSGLAQ